MIFSLSAAHRFIFILILWIRHRSEINKIRIEINNNNNRKMNERIKKKTLFLQKCHAFSRPFHCNFNKLLNPFIHSTLNAKRSTFKIPYYTRSLIIIFQFVLLIFFLSPLFFSLCRRLCAFHWNIFIYTLRALHLTDMGGSYSNKWMKRQR